MKPAAHLASKVLAVGVVCRLPCSSPSVSVPSIAVGKVGTALQNLWAGKAGTRYATSQGFIMTFLIREAGLCVV